mmetsp:Transcript_153584/g.492261  ORF Transcript_153584/g.492261 Transcript_153584/m.492261 type:complete len:1098 (-) Transcript_153584:103-3396(-)
MGIVHARRHEEALEYDQARSRAKTYLDKCRPEYVKDDVLAGLAPEDPDEPRLNNFEIPDTILFSHGSTYDLTAKEDDEEGPQPGAANESDHHRNMARAKLTLAYTALLEGAAKGYKYQVQKICRGAQINVNAQDQYGRSAMFLASERGHAAVIAVLMGGHASLDLCNKDGWSPLHAAAFHGQVGCIDQLVKGSADINARDHYGCTPVTLAASSPKLTLMDLIAKRDRKKLKKIRQEVVKKHEKDGKENTEGTSLSALKHVPPHMVWTHFPNRVDLIVLDRLLQVRQVQVDPIDRKKRTPLNYAARYGRTISVSRLLYAKADVRRADADGRTALMQAASNDHYEAAELLLRAGSIVNATDQQIRTPLHGALSTGNEALAYLLLNADASVNAYDCEGRTPILLAMDANNRRLFTELIQRRSNLDVVDKRGWNVIIYAIEAGMLGDIAPRLLKVGDKVQRILRARDPQGRNAMHHAVQLPNVRAANKAVEVLSKMDNQCAIFGDCNGDTALHMAAESGRLEALRLLIAQMAQPRADYENNRKETPLHYAAHGGHLACVLMLVGNYGKGEPPCDAGAVDSDGKTLLMHACISGHLDLVNLLLSTREGKRDDLIFPPLDVNHQDNSGSTALILAAREGHWALLPSLVLAGANLSVVDEDGFSALHWAASEDEALVTSCLLDLSLDPNVTDAKSWTPLMHAVSRGADEVTRVLLDGGSNLYARNFDGDTALQICHRRQDAPELVQLTYDLLTDGLLNQLTPSKHLIEAKGHLMVSVLDAVDLYMEGKLGELNTYVCVMLHTHQGATPLVAFTSCMMKSPDPEWHEVFRFDIESLDPSACLVAWVVAAPGDSEDQIKQSTNFGTTEEQLAEQTRLALLRGEDITKKPANRRAKQENFNTGLTTAFGRLTRKGDKSEEMEVQRLRKLAMAQSKGCEPTMDLVIPKNVESSLAARRWNEVANLRALLERSGCEIQDPLVPRSHLPLGCVLVRFRQLRTAVWDPAPVEISRTLRLNCRGNLRIECEFRPQYFETKPENRAVLVPAEVEDRNYTVRPLDYTNCEESVGQLMGNEPFIPEKRRARPKQFSAKAFIRKKRAQYLLATGQF